MQMKLAIKFISNPEPNDKNKMYIKKNTCYLKPSQETDLKKKKGISKILK